MSHTSESDMHDEFEDFARQTLGPKRGNWRFCVETRLLRETFPKLIVDRNGIALMGLWGGLHGDCCWNSLYCHITEKSYRIETSIEVNVGAFLGNCRKCPMALCKILLKIPLNEAINSWLQRQLWNSEIPVKQPQSLCNLFGIYCFISPSKQGGSNWTKLWNFRWPNKQSEI